MIKANLKLIMDELESVITPELVSAGLDAFDEYLTRNPKRSDDKELCIYLDEKRNNTTEEMVSFIIQAQLARVVDTEKASEYFDIIYEAVNDISPSLIGYITKEDLVCDQYPIDKNTSTVFLFFVVTYSRPLDDCD